MASGGSPAARGWSIEGGRKLFLGELPLRGAAGLEKGRCGFWGSPAARGCSIKDERKMRLLGVSRCAGLLD